jgi:glycerate kinase
MKVTIAPDSLKESLGSPAAAAAIARGVRTVLPAAELVLVPVADGGEGTMQAIVEATGGAVQRARVPDPLGRMFEAEWGLCGDGRTAVIEMARASGLELLRPEERDPMRATTSGTGGLIASALDAGARKLIVGIGGSATVDGGTGMAEALGVRFLRSDGTPIQGCCGGTLSEIADIDMAGLDPRIAATDLVVACDVTNPLTGQDGAARTYGPQKGADAAQVEELESGLASLADAMRRCLRQDLEDMPGAGAAGGLGAGLVAFLGARLQSGVETVMEAARLREKMQGSDLVITAEGRLDWQSAFGKATAGVAGAASELGIPVVALAGTLGEGFAEVYAHGVSAAFSITDGPMSLAAAMDDAGDLLARAAESVLRLWIAARGGRDG